MLRSKNKLEQIASGSTFKEVSGKEMSNFIVDIPVLKIQKEIVHKLNPVSKGIEKNNEINDNLTKKLENEFYNLFFESFNNKYLVIFNNKNHCRRLGKKYASKEF